MFEDEPRDLMSETDLSGDDSPTADEKKSEAADSRGGVVDLDEIKLNEIIEVDPKDARIEELERASEDWRARAYRSGCEADPRDDLRIIHTHRADDGNRPTSFSIQTVRGGDQGAVPQPRHGGVGSKQYALTRAVDKLVEQVQK